ncbi:hypothetical protein AVEN_268384-1 [Araneus ventricosus]|uniref:Uncharacterized protein n=1 Tax=Araneus ventricosus TaxID=182803 RepID=A0A4Y2DVE5_ARAVE|nr:hypothetical protein AVEN_268384-1 [Araneus ventricosus]
MSIYLRLFNETATKTHNTRVDSSESNAINPRWLHRGGAGAECGGGCRRDPLSESEASLFARRRHWGNATSPGTFSGAGTDANRWETASRLRSPSCGSAHTTAAAVPLGGV